jgi:uncharacterized protein YegP (UPF0339 family)
VIQLGGDHAAELSGRPQAASGGAYDPFDTVPTPAGGPAMKFQVKKTPSGEFRFNLLASNGQVVATSESYSRKQSALETIESIKKNVGSASVEEVGD